MEKQNAADNAALLEKMVADLQKKVASAPKRTYNGALLLAKEYKDAVLEAQPLIDTAAEEYGKLAILDLLCDAQDVDPATIEGLETIVIDAPNAKGKMTMYIHRPKDVKADEV